MHVYITVVERFWVGPLTLLCTIIVLQSVLHMHGLAVGSPSACARILADLNLAVQYGIAIRIYMSEKFWQILIWWLLGRSAKLPNLIPHKIFGYTISQTDI